MVYYPDKNELFLCNRREEVSAEAQRVLRALPKSSEKEGPKPMPSFPDMVAYVQEKVRLCAYFPFSWRRYTPKKNLIKNVTYLFFILSSPGGSEDQDSS